MAVYWRRLKLTVRLPHMYTFYTAFNVECRFFVPFSHVLCDPRSLTLEIWMVLPYRFQRMSNNQFIKWCGHQEWTAIMWTFKCSREKRLGREKWFGLLSFSINCHLMLIIFRFFFCNGRLTRSENFMYQYFKLFLRTPSFNRCLWYDIVAKVSKSRSLFCIR